MRSALRPLLSAWGEPRPLPGLAASAAQSIPWTLLLGLCLVYTALACLVMAHGVVMICWALPWLVRR